MAALRQGRPDRHGESWPLLAGEHERIAAWVKDKVPARKVGELLARSGVVVPERTLNRYIDTTWPEAAASTVPVADGEPGGELQVDFGELGLMLDGETGKRRKVWALVFTAVYSRHSFVWLSFRQNLETVIAGFEAAWVFFGGVFRVVIPDNMATIVTTADACAPGFNEAFTECAQSRGFVVDPARVRSPRSKPRVERTVQFVQSSFWAGEDFGVLGRGAGRRRVVVPDPGRVAGARHDPVAALTQLDDVVAIGDLYRFDRFTAPAALWDELQERFPDSTPGSGAPQGRARRRRSPSSTGWSTTPPLCPALGRQTPQRPQQRPPGFRTRSRGRMARPG